MKTGQKRPALFCVSLIDDMLAISSGQYESTKNKKEETCVSPFALSPLFLCTLCVPVSPVSSGEHHPELSCGK